jgi:hypothetical protein
MSKTGNLIANLQKYATRPEWETLLDAVMREHIERAADVIRLPMSEIGDIVGDQSGEFIATVFEDFATRRRVDGTCMAAEYLKRAGWRENGYARKYLEALINSRLRLYEVTDVKPGTGMSLRPLDVPKGKNEEPVFVHEKSGSQFLLRWDVISARVLRVQEEFVLAGGVLPVRPDQPKNLLKAYARLRKADSSGSDPMPSLCTTAWIAWLYESQNAPGPHVTNRDGDELLMSKCRLPLLARADEIAAVMNTLPEWEPASDHHLRWVWLSTGEAPATKPKSRRKPQQVSPAGTLLGEAVLESKHLVFTTNSRQRMERGLHALQKALGNKVGPAMTSYEQMDLNAIPVSGGAPATESTMPSPDEQHGMILAILDRHYRETLRMPIPALGNKTPAQAVKTKAGREKTIAWLKDLERSTAQGAAHRGMPVYDFGWMWEELGLNEAR